jgi:hypothetical protein
VPVTRINSAATQKPSQRLRPEPKLEIVIGTFSKGMVLQLVDDWIVPALVEKFMRSRTNLPEAIRREHNEGHL